MNLSYIFIFCGIVLIVVGFFIWLGFPIGKLPGDVHIKGERTNIYIPIFSSIVISIVLTLLLNAIFWVFKK